MLRYKPVAIETFIKRWNGTERAERANYVSFLNELCNVLDVELPDPASGNAGAYRFERGVTHHESDGTSNPRRIDLYRRGHFVLEAKQGAAAAPIRVNLFGETETTRRAMVRHSKGWAQEMFKAKGQAEGYTRDLPVAEATRPF